MELKNSDSMRPVLIEPDTTCSESPAVWSLPPEMLPVLPDSPDAAANPRVPVVESAEFCCVLRSRLGRHSLVYGAEVDGLDPHHPGQ